MTPYGRERTAADAEADGWFDAWSGFDPDPTLLHPEKFIEDYMRGYDSWSRT